METRQQFLDALEENEDDTATRLVYADWLDDQGEHEEADHQRNWPAAKNWLIDFCEEYNGDAEGEIVLDDFDELNDYFFDISYQRLIILGYNALKRDSKVVGLDCGANQTMCDALRENAREFWNNWSIVTGIPLPRDVDVQYYFRCSC